MLIRPFPDMRTEQFGILVPSDPFTDEEWHALLHRTPDGMWGFREIPAMRAEDV